MSVTNVYHKSRDLSVTLNFSETENSLSWVFTAENDGEIYAVDSTNIASYLIQGNPVTLPFQIIAGQSYSVSITKNTTGLPASIVLKTRRSINKSTSLTVPDFGAYDGRYVAVISQDSLFIIDTDLINPANSPSKGVFTVNPIIQVVSLPLISEENISWNNVSFVVIQGVQYFVCATTSTTASGYKLYSCLVRVSDYEVFDLTMTPNQKTLIYSHTSFSSNNTMSIIVDYINDILIFRLIGTNTSLVMYDLNTGNISYKSSSSTETLVLTSSTLNPHMQFIPFTNELCSGDILINPYTSANRNKMKSAVMSVYDKVNNQVYTFNGNITTQMVAFNLNGAMSGSFGCTGDSAGNRGLIMSLSSEIGYLVSLGGPFVIAHYLRPLSTGISKSINTPSGHTNFKSLYPSKKNLFYVATGVGGDSSLRLYIFKPDEGYSGIDYNYLDFVSEIRGCCSNQILS